MMSVELFADSDILERLKGIFIDNALRVVINLIALHYKIDVFPVRSGSLGNLIYSFLGAGAGEGGVDSEFAVLIEKITDHLGIFDTVFQSLPVFGKLECAILAVIGIFQNAFSKGLQGEDCPVLVRPGNDELLAGKLNAIAVGDIL